MKFRWQSFFHLAEKVAVEGGAVLWSDPDFGDECYDSAHLSEALLRCAVSRAYYAAFNETREWWDQNFPAERIPESQSHFELIERLGRREEWRQVSHDLKELRRYRIEVDYKLRVKDLHRKAISSVALANSLLNQIGALEP